MAAEECEVFFIKNLRNQAHAGSQVKVGAVAGSDPGAFLTTVLERVKPVKRQAGDIFSGSVDSEHPAGFTWTVVSWDHYAR